MKTIRISATKPAAFIVSAALATTTLGLWGIARWADAPNGARVLANRELSGLTGLYPNYGYNYGNCECANATAAAITNPPNNNYYPDCACSAFPGQRCVSCLEGALPLTGFFQTGTNDHVQPAGGSDVSCSNAKQYRGLCEASGGCVGLIQDGQCTGTIPPFTEEGIIGFRQPSTGHTEGTLGG